MPGAFPPLPWPLRPWDAPVMPRGRVAALVVVLAVLGVAGTWVVAVGGPRAAYYAVRYQGDEAAFGSYVADQIGSSYWQSDHPEIGPNDRRWALAHPEEVLGEGRDACRWLRSQRRAPRIRTHTGPYSYGDVAERYGQFSTRLDPYLSLSGQSTIVAGAWSYLCPAELRQRIARGPED